MILHQQILHPANAPREPWLALHCESLALALCEQRGHRITITPIDTILPTGPITNAAAPTPDHLILVAEDIRRHIPGSTTEISKLITDHLALDAETYLLVNSLDGTTPGILHIQDPVALYLADSSTGTLASAEHFRSTIDLSVDGWAYWWEDAQRAFHKLTVSFMEECGIQIPEKIRNAVKHD